MRILSIFTLALCVFFYFDLSWAKEDFKEGDKLYRSKCASCHRLLPPKDHPLEKWQKYVEKYGKKLKEDEKKKILQYLEGEINARPR